MILPTKGRQVGKAGPVWRTRMSSERGGRGLLCRPALIPSPERRLEEAWNRVPQAADIAIVSIQNCKCPPIFFLECCAARPDFLIAEWNALTKGCANCLIGGHLSNQRLDMGRCEPEVSHEGLIQRRRVGIAAKHTGLKCAYFIDQAWQPYQACHCVAPPSGWVLSKVHVRFRISAGEEGAAEAL